VWFIFIALSGFEGDAFVGAMIFALLITGGIFWLGPKVLALRRVPDNNVTDETQYYQYNVTIMKEENKIKETYERDNTSSILDLDMLEVEEITQGLDSI